MFIPAYLVRKGEESAENRDWLARLPSIIKQIETDWGLRLKQPYFEQVSCSYVVACETQNGQPAVLKVGLPHEEALHEIEGLKLLDGDPTVRLFRFNKEWNAMLLEQCLPGKHLRFEPIAYQNEVISRSLKRIWQTTFSVQHFRPLSSMVRHWNEEAFALLNEYPDPGLARAACQLKEELVKTTEKHVLLATDLHAGNILRAERKKWLVIDIKPYYGDPSYDLTQHLMNCLEVFMNAPKAMTKQLANRMQLNGERLRAWMFARLASENGGNYQKLALRLGVDKQFNI